MHENNNNNNSNNKSKNVLDEKYIFFEVDKKLLRA
jgi:hypothetical protein